MQKCNKLLTFNLPLDVSDMPPIYLDATLRSAFLFAL